MKGLLSLPQERMFYMDMKPYHQEASKIEADIQTLMAISDTFRSENIPFTVIIFPYEYQLRPEVKLKGNDIFLPQEVMSSYLAKN